MMLNTVTALCALAASSVVLATNEAPQISIPGLVNNAQPVPPPVVAANGSPAEVGYAPQVLVASQQYAADKSNQIQQQQGQARAGENSVGASSEELLLSDIFDSISNMVDEHSSKHSSDDGLSSGAGHQFSSVFGYNAIAAASATIATSIGVALAFF